MTTEDIIAAFGSSDPEDLANIRRYIEWIKIRRRIHHRFYFQAHWVTWAMSQLPAPPRAHWL